MSIIEQTHVIPKVEKFDDASLSSLGSSPEAGDATAPMNPLVAKRKGGRKPIYATSEERKQRNRQAQAAFRERRTEYIKQLESTIKQQDDQVQTLQQSHWSAAEECLMLRYKNSLLERILLEKGIDVQAELKSKELPAPGNLVGHPSKPIPRAALPRHQQLQRSHSRGSGSVPPLQMPAPMVAHQSPRSQPTPSSQTSSPTSAQSPGFALQGGMLSPRAGFHAQHQRQQQPPPSLPATLRVAPYAAVALPDSHPSSAVATPSTAGGTSTDGTKKQEEYADAHADLLDEESIDQTAGPGPYPHQPPTFPPPLFPRHAYASAPPIIDTSHPMIHGLDHGVDQESYMHSATQLFDHVEPIIEADAFGLTTSMLFPTHFAFHESSMRK